LAKHAPLHPPTKKRQVSCRQISLEMDLWRELSARELKTPKFQNCQWLLAVAIHYT